MAPLLTVGIPVYNGMPFLPDAIESVLSQTFNDYELVVINDGSTDGSWEYLQSLKDSRLRLVSQSNQGLTATLNRMLKEARTPWLVRLDADDVCRNGRLAIAAEAVQKYPHAGMFYSRAALHQHAGITAQSRSTEGSPRDLRDLTRSGYLLAICHVSTTLNIAKTRSLGGYRFNLHVEDLDLWWRMALHYDIVFLPKVTVDIRLNEGSSCISNLQKLSANTLYIQYLLLSNLWNLPSFPYEQVIPHLAKMVDKQYVAYREQMWKAGSHLGRSQYREALPHLARAVLHSPGHFLRRLQYPLRPNPMIRVGESPQAFRKLNDQLWPSESISAITSPTARQVLGPAAGMS
jgi:glycosyltransferase involved in cell wall biosynthesis